MDLQFSSMYPGSLLVAVALRKAADNGVIDVNDLEAVSKGTALYFDSVRRLHEFKKFLATSPAVRELPANFTLGYVESYLWTRYSQSDGKILIDVHTDGPAVGEAVVLTGEPVLTDLLAGRLSVDRALAEGIVLIEADEVDTAAIHHALKTTSMAK
jgi:hypothetical protein